MGKLAAIVGELFEVDRELEPLSQAVELLSGGQSETTQEPPAALAHSFDNLPLVDLDIPEFREDVVREPLGQFRSNAAYRSPRGTGKEIEKAVVRIIKDAGRPLPTQAIYREMIARGIHVPGQRPASNLAAHLAVSARFKRTNHGWDVVPKATKEEEPS